MVSSLIDREDVRATLRADSGKVALGIIVVTIALAAFVAFRARKRGRDRALFWFGTWSLLYGVRLLIDTEVVPFVLGWGRLACAYAGAAITYVIGIPIALFLYDFLPDWRKYVRWLIWVNVVFAVLALAADAFTQRPFSMAIANNTLVLAWLSAAFVAMFWTKATTPDMRMVRFGLTVCGIGVVAGNVLGIAGARGFNPEPLGFVVFLVCVGQVVVSRAIRTDEKLTEIEKELEIARRIQQSILPAEPPRATGLQIATRYLPMTAVAGDFYDFLTIGPERVGILVADVSGHGVPAALIASMVKVAIAAQAPHADDPARVLTGMNQTLCGKLKGQFVTAAYLFIDRSAGTFRYAGAGHPPMLWARQGSSVRKVEENGLMLGAFPVAKYSFFEDDLQSGDRFLLYTDGVTEARNAHDDFFGDDRLETTVTGAAEADADRCASILVDRVADWGGNQDDDVTVVVVDISETAGYATTRG